MYNAAGKAPGHESSIHMKERNVMNSHPRNFLLRILKKEPVLAVSAVCMLFSMLFVPPTAAYADYIDFRVLALLFCLMAVVAGLQRCNFFTRMAQLLLTGKKDGVRYS